MKREEVEVGVFIRFRPEDDALDGLIVRITNLIPREELFTVEGISDKGAKILADFLAPSKESKFHYTDFEIPSALELLAEAAE